MPDLARAHLNAAPVGGLRARGKACYTLFVQHVPGPLPEHLVAACFATCGPVAAWKPARDYTHYGAAARNHTYGMLVYTSFASMARALLLFGDPLLGRAGHAKPFPLPPSDTSDPDQPRPCVALYPDHSVRSQIDAVTPEQRATWLGDGMPSASAPKRAAAEATPDAADAAEAADTADTNASTGDDDKTAETAEMAEAADPEDAAAAPHDETPADDPMDEDAVSPAPGAVAAAREPPAAPVSGVAAAAPSGESGRSRRRGASVHGDGFAGGLTAPWRLDDALAALDRLYDLMRAGTGADADAAAGASPAGATPDTPAGGAAAAAPLGSRRAHRPRPARFEHRPAGGAGADADADAADAPSDALPLSLPDATRALLAREIEIFRTAASRTDHAKRVASASAADAAADATRARHARERERDRSDQSGTRRGGSANGAPSPLSYVQQLQQQQQQRAQAEARAQRRALDDAAAAMEAAMRAEAERLRAWAAVAAEAEAAAATPLDGALDALVARERARVLAGLEAWADAEAAHPFETDRAQWWSRAGPHARRALERDARDRRQDPDACDRDGRPQLVPPASVAALREAWAARRAAQQAEVAGVVSAAAMAVPADLDLLDGVAAALAGVRPDGGGGGGGSTGTSAANAVPARIMSREERAAATQALVARIPSDREGLFAWPLRWNLLDAGVLARAEAFIGAKVAEFLGEPDADLVAFVMRLVEARMPGDAVLAELQDAFGPDADVFVKRFWRFIIYELEARAEGLA
ncbi:hypothetical protein CXG81DRAFT_26197 [Caulochytrium protostelioides]|uniref:PWI domain-containing protein n=1 Tax=Caulochytrium protostelioides TaxID=1555241 RepID=A0A4P9X798_9FUNG|nr:hypothetical protein CXG81DRAFT_26197 [Caulochytrium protostelioides]|eukprot:RKP01095.1 hypothetical protein CXG81DRAFT_26197 [Caulochytrium protostelioides]